MDNEFIEPKLTAQIDQLASATFVALFLKKESPVKELAETVVEKLILISERTKFLGTCQICEVYFQKNVGSSLTIL
jgi:hypothetical protein